MKTLLEYIKDYYPDTYTPTIQLLGGVMFGLIFGAFNAPLIFTLFSYFFFEIILRLATLDRPWMYSIKWRLISITLAFSSWLLSNYIWNRGLYLRIIY